MKRTLRTLMLCTALAMASSVGLAGEAITVPTLGTTGFNYYQGSYSLGFSFTANANAQVTALGFYDDLKNGLTQSHPVGIYDPQTQALLVSATVLPTDPLSNFFHYTTLATPLNLVAGKSYVIMALVRSENYLAFSSIDPTWIVDPAITYTGGAVNYANPSATTLLYPDTPIPGGPASGGDFGPNFILAAAPTGPQVTVSPASLTFGPQTVGTASAPQVITYSSVGATPATITSIASNGDFTESGNCPLSPSSLAPGSSCQVSVTFLPNLGGTRTGNVSIVDDAPGGNPRTIALSGTGSVATTPTIAVMPVLSFPPTQAGSASTPLSLPVANNGAGTLVISALQIAGGEFTIVRDGCTGVPVSPSPPPCLLDIVFTPAAAGARGTTLRIISNAPASPTLVTLLGTGTAAPAGTLDAIRAITFTDQVVGTSSAPQPLTITNVGTVDVAVSSVSLSGDFSQANDCDVIAPGAGCVVQVTFTPGSIAAINGALTILSNASNAAFTVSLAGNGVGNPAPVVELSVTNTSYGSRVMGGSSAPQVVTLRNAGGADLALGDIYMTGEFTRVSRCPAVVAPGATCTIEVSFAPSVPGPRTGSLIVLSNAPAGPKALPLGGTGCRFFSLRGARTGGLLCQ